jgi:hypothetical protein
MTPIEGRWRLAVDRRGTRPDFDGAIGGKRRRDGLSAHEAAELRLRLDVFEAGMAEAAEKNMPATRAELRGISLHPLLISGRQANEGGLLHVVRISLFTDTEIRSSCNAQVFSDCAASRAAPIEDALHRLRALSMLDGPETENAENRSACRHLASIRCVASTRDVIRVPIFAADDEEAIRKTAEIILAFRIILDPLGSLDRAMSPKRLAEALSEQAKIVELVEISRTILTGKNDDPIAKAIENVRIKDRSEASDRP